MASKRSSKRFTLTRDDFLLDPQDVQCQDGLRVVPIPCGAGGKKQFRLVLEDSADKISDLDSLADDLRNAGLQMPVVENVVNALLDVIPRYIAKTRRSVRIGNLVTMTPCVKGSLDSTTDNPDPKKSHLEIHATVSPALRHSLSRIKLVNVNRRQNALGKVICKMDKAKADVVDAEHDIYVNGSSIYVPQQSATDDGTQGCVWIETLDGKRLGRCAVLVSGRDLLTVRFVPDKPVGECDARIVVETYGTEEAAEIGDKSAFARYFRTVKLLACAAR